MERKIKNVIYYCLPPILVLVAFVSVFSNDVWVDEVYSLELCKHPFFEMLSIASLDVHPPLYYMFLRAGIVLLSGVIDYIYVGKLVSIVPYIILLIIGYKYIGKKYGQNVAFFFNIFIVGMPKMLIYSTEIRMYAWGMLFVTCAFLQLPRVLKDSKKISNYVLLSVFSAMAAYTHYFACASAIVIYFEIFIAFIFTKKYKEIINLILSGLAVVVLYIPWLFIFLQQTAVVVDDYWIESPTITSVIKNILFLFSANKLIDVLTLSIFAIGLIGIILSKEKIKNIAICGIGVWAGTLAFGIILSIILRPIFVSRYIMGSAACMWLGVSIGISQIKTTKVKNIGIITLVLLSSCVVSANYVSNEISSKNTFESTVANLGKNIAQDTVVVSDNIHVQRIISYFFPQNVIMVYDEPVSELTSLVYSDCKLEELHNVQDLKKMSSNYVLLDVSGKLKDVFEQDGYNLEKVGEGIVSWYSFNTYAVGAK